MGAGDAAGGEDGDCEEGGKGWHVGLFCVLDGGGGLVGGGWIVGWCLEDGGQVVRGGRLEGICKQSSECAVRGIYRRNDPGLYRNGDLVGDRGVIRGSCVLASIARSEASPMYGWSASSAVAPSTKGTFLSLAYHDGYHGYQTQDVDSIIDGQYQSTNTTI